MIQVERWEKIEHYLETSAYASIADIMELTLSSRATVRRDLDALAKEGRLSLTHGGAVSIFKKTPVEGSYEEKSVNFSDEKDRIAKMACSLLNPGDRVFIDAGTTTYKLIPYLSKIDNLTVITNDVNIASRLYNVSNISLVILGGFVRPGYTSIIGCSAELQASEMNADICIVGTDALCKKGIFIANLDEVGIKRSIINNSKKVVIVADHSKIGLDSFAKVSPLESIDVVITNAEAKEKISVEKMDTKCKFMFA